MALNAIIFYIMFRFYKFSENWRQFFQKEKAILSNALSDQKISMIEHIGATSVVLCNTAGTIDILLSIPSDLDLFTVKNVLSIRGYIFVEEKSTTTTLFFLRRDENGHIVATVRLVEYASDDYNKYKLFKFYLKEKDSHVTKYNDFRYTLAVNSKGNHQEYEKGKAAYIESILENCSKK